MEILIPFAVIYRGLPVAVFGWRFEPCYRTNYLQALECLIPVFASAINIDYFHCLLCAPLEWRKYFLEGTPGAFLFCPSFPDPWLCALSCCWIKTLAWGWGMAWCHCLPFSLSSQLIFPSPCSQLSFLSPLSISSELSVLIFQRLLCWGVGEGLYPFLCLFTLLSCFCW